MRTYTQSHVEELKALLTHLRGLGKVSARYKNIPTDEEAVGCYVLTVSVDDGAGYSLNTPERREIIESLAENKFLFFIDGPENGGAKTADPAVRHYLIDNYDYLLERLSILLEELKP